MGDEQTVHTEQTVTTPVEQPQEVTQTPVEVPDGAQEQPVPIELPAKIVTDPREDQPA